MNNKGFTLMEMLATVVIVGILLSITTISIVGYINDSREKARQVEESNIISAAQTYLKEKGGWGNDDTACVTIENLKTYGYLARDKDFEPYKAVRFERNATTKVITKKEVKEKDDCS